MNKTQINKFNKLLEANSALQRLVREFMGVSRLFEMEVCDFMDTLGVRNAEIKDLEDKLFTPEELGIIKTLATRENAKHDDPDDTLINLMLKLERLSNG